MNIFFAPHVGTKLNSTNRLEDEGDEPTKQTNTKDRCFGDDI